ncbi:MAG: hypothetical protein AABZ32_00675, partial [Bacteroidota bacterium]
MQTLTFTLETDSAFNAKHLSDFLKTLPHIKSVSTEKLLEKLSDADWIKPGRPATNEEFEEMIVASMKGKAIPAEASRNRTLKKFEQW